MDAGQPKYSIKNEKYYYIAITAAGLLLLAGGVAYEYVLKSRIVLPECLIHAATGISCPACGGTRAVISLLEGNIIESLLYNPVVLYAVVLWCLYVGINTVLLLFFHKKNRMMHFTGKYVLIGIVLLAVNFVMKNV